MAESVHPYTPDAGFNGGDLDCGNGLLLMIRQHIDPLEPGQLLEIVSYESTVEVDLPSWCNLTHNDLVNVHSDVDSEGRRRWSFLVCKGAFTPPETADTAPAAASEGAAPSAPDGAAGFSFPDASATAGVGKRKRKRKKVQMEITQPVVEPFIPETLPEPAPAPAVEPLSVVTQGSWPRPRWLLSALHQHLEGRLTDEEFAETADDAVRLVLAAQERAGVDVVTDGEQRRDNYSSFVAGLLQNTQLIPVTDLLPYVDDPEEFGRELRALDVPADEVRHPAVFGPLGRDRPLAAHEVEFVQSVTDTPVKACLPGPYLLTRTMWMECISDRAYDDRESLARDVVRVLREEIADLMARGTALVQLDEPVLTEVLYGTAGGGGRTFMCGALGERKDSGPELEFARGLLREATAGFDPHRLSLHVCRGNWTPDESAALSGDFAPLVPLFAEVNVGNLILELCTSRAGELSALRGIRDDQRVGVGVVNQKIPEIPEVDEIVSRARAAIDELGRDRVLLTTDCGFATFADNPIVSAKIAEGQLAAMARARDVLRG
ncbi:hypothetical protein [Corynebacterium frankenforstense]|uniref:hypothetical protein n=1 Tax=Corynebacterium frankenforstense TaxID=1230998 RepID=UPI0026F1A446|nr:hypothetical protein [Corynebacterium frankenforstense]